MKEKTLLYRNTKLKLQHLGSCDPPGGTPHLNQVYTGKEEPHGTHPAPSGRPSRGGHSLATRPASPRALPFGQRPRACRLSGPGGCQGGAGHGSHPGSIHSAEPRATGCPWKERPGPGPALLQGKPDLGKGLRHAPACTRGSRSGLGHGCLQPPSPRGSGPPSGTTT